MADGNAVELNNQRWQQILRKVGGLGDCRFPASSEIEIEGTPHQATITMKAKGLHKNMQSDGAAFEGWALTLLLHCGVQSVRIGVDPVAAQTRSQHYERFLYRLKRFSELFPERVIADWPATPPRALNTEMARVFNQSSAREELTEAVRLERMKAASQPKHTEDDLEKALEVSKGFRRHFQLDKVMRQWPVGLFEGTVAGGNEIFTGKKSAIDLIGIRGDTLVLFELKKADNRKVGAVSELLFYACAMRDAMGAGAIFKFRSLKANRNCPIGPEDVLRCSRIHAVLLAKGFHRLVTGPSIVLAELNAAMQRSGSDVPISFDTAAISDYPHDERGDFVFSGQPSF